LILASSRVYNLPIALREGFLDQNKPVINRTGVRLLFIREKSPFHPFFPLGNLPYNTKLKEFSRQLRNHSTLGEILLWKKLRAGSMMFYQFNRQKPLDRYIVDFYCKPLTLVIEIDGSYHNHPEQRIKDKERQQILESMGLNFLRFSEMQVRKDMEFVLKVIRAYILDFEATHPEIKEKPSRYRK